MKGDRDCSERMQAKTLRILRTIDILAVYRFPKPLKEVHREVCQVTGLRCSRRTVHRDLLILMAMGLVQETSGGFLLDLKRSERLQAAACAIFANAG